MFVPLSRRLQANANRSILDEQTRNKRDTKESNTLFAQNACNREFGLLEHCCRGIFRRIIDIVRLLSAFLLSLAMPIESLVGISIFSHPIQCMCGCIAALRANCLGNRVHCSVFTNAAGISHYHAYLPISNHATAIPQILTGQLAHCLTASIRQSTRREHIDCMRSGQTEQINQFSDRVGTRTSACLVLRITPKFDYCHMVKRID